MPALLKARDKRRSILLKMWKKQGQELSIRLRQLGSENGPRSEEITQNKAEAVQAAGSHPRPRVSRRQEGSKAVFWVWSAQWSPARAGKKPFIQWGHSFIHSYTHAFSCSAGD